MRIPQEKWSALAGLLLTYLSASSKVCLAEEGLDFDVDQLIANEKAWATEAQSAEIPFRSVETTIVGARSDAGLIHIFAYDDALTFQASDYQNAVGYLKVAATSAPLTVSLPVASADRIAMFAYHDENGDEVLNKRNQVPEEAYGFSGGVNPYLQPRFEAASFSADSITIHLVTIPKR